MSTFGSLTADACAEALATITRDAEATSVNEAELERRIDMIIEPYLATPGEDDSSQRRVLLVQRLQQKCDGPACRRVSEYILQSE